MIFLGQQSPNLFLNQDTAMEIDSSDDDEKAQVVSGSALKSSSNDMPRRVGLRSTYKRRYYLKCFV